MLAWSEGNCQKSEMGKAVGSFYEDKAVPVLKTLTVFFSFLLSTVCLVLFAQSNFLLYLLNPLSLRKRFKIRETHLVGDAEHNSPRVKFPTFS